MKYIIILLTVALFSCSKQSENITERPQTEAISSTYWLHLYEGNTYVGTILSFHECNITNPMIIAQRKATPAMQGICDSDNVLELKLAKPCPVPCPLKDSIMKALSNGN